MLDAEEQERIDADWAKAFPDPALRDIWRTAFDGDRVLAIMYAQHFAPADADAAYAWSRSRLPDAATGAYLHAHGRTPGDYLEEVIDAVRYEDSTEFSQAFYDALMTRVALYLVHPHLTREDRVTIARAGLTLTEVDHLIATGTYDRDRLTLLRGLR